MDYQFILMRHAESQHNEVKKAIKKKFNVKKVKDHPHYEQMRYCPSLRDRSITPKGAQQCYIIAQELDWDNIGLIFTSPLKRCLETTQNMLHDAGKTIPVIVEPLLSSRLANIWSVGSDWSLLKQLYPAFEFSNDDIFDLPWYFKCLTSQKQQKIKGFEDPIDGLKAKIEETYEQFRDRLPKLKEKFEKIRQKLPEKRILIVSHSCSLKNITAVTFTEKHKAVAISQFENMTPVYLQYHALFSSTKEL